MLSSLRVDFQFVTWPVRVINSLTAIDVKVVFQIYFKCPGFIEHDEECMLISYANRSTSSLEGINNITWQAYCTHNFYVWKVNSLKTSISTQNLFNIERQLTTDSPEVAIKILRVPVGEMKLL